MSVLSKLALAANSILSPFDIKLIRKSEFNQLSEALDCGATSYVNELPDGAASYLTPENPRLIELTTSYAEFSGSVVESSRWTHDYISRNIDLRNFRGDNAYIFSEKNVESTYVLTAYYLEQIDRLKLLNLFEEDGLFGAPMIEFRQGKFVSRDLLDSVNEICFLQDQLHLNEIPDLRIIDIGAGYGRVAHRLVTALPNLEQILCADAIAFSTFCCEYYLRFRQLEGKATALTLSEIEPMLERNQVHLALNIHSFSECRLSAIEWWIELLQKNKVKYLMIVPNAADHHGTKLLSQEANGERIDFSTVLTDHGYQQIACTPKYADSIIQRLGASPTYYYLFELK